MAARADFACIACDEVMELPLKAAACPVCGGLLERRFTTAPAVLRGAEQGREPVTARLVEHAAADEFDAQRSKTEHKPDFASTAVAAGDPTMSVRSREGMRLNVPAAFNAIPADGRAGSRAYSAPVLHAIGRAGGPKPRRPD